MKQIHSNYSFDNTQAVHIQLMDGYSPVIFYDFDDYVQTLCNTSTEIYNDFKTLLEKVIPYKTHTKNSIQLQEALLQSNTILVLQLLSQAQTAKW